MMNYVANQMLRMFCEDTGSPELRVPELGKLQSGDRRRGPRKSSRREKSPAICAWMSYEQLKRM